MQEEVKEFKKVQPRKVLRFNPNLKYAIETHQDCKFAQVERTRRSIEKSEGDPPYRFTFGTVGDNFSGAITIKASEAVPKMIILIFNPTDECYDIETIKSEEAENGGLHESGESSNTANSE
jgi:hypothetical protein